MTSSIADSGAKDLDRYRVEGSRFRGAHDGTVKRAYSSQHDPMPSEEYARRLVQSVFGVDRLRG